MCGGRNDVTCALMLLQSLMLNLILPYLKQLTPVRLNIQESLTLSVSLARISDCVNSFFNFFKANPAGITALPYRITSRFRHDNIIHTIYLSFALS